MTKNSPCCFVIFMLLGIEDFCGNFFSFQIKFHNKCYNTLKKLALYTTIQYYRGDTTTSKWLDNPIVAITFNNGCGHTTISSRDNLTCFTFLKFIFNVGKYGFMTIRRYPVTLCPSRLLQSCRCFGAKVIVT